MAKAHYEIVEHDGGWAYRLRGHILGDFCHQSRRRSSRSSCCSRQKLPGESEDIEFEDSKGR